MASTTHEPGSASQCLLHNIEHSGIHTTVRNRRLYVSGPSGTEHVARLILNNPGAFATLSCTCQSIPADDAVYDTGYCFGQMLTLFTPGRFTHEEYNRLVTLRARFIGADRT